MDRVCVPARVGAEPGRVKVQVGDVVVLAPALQAAAPVVRPLQGLPFGVGDDGLERKLPVDGGAEILDVGVDQHHVGVGTSLRPAFAHGHVAVGQPAFVLVHVQQRLDHLRLGLRIDNGQERVLRPKTVPDAARKAAG